MRMIERFFPLTTAFPFGGRTPWEVTSSLPEILSAIIPTLGEEFVIELFSFPSPPPRPTRPEAAGLRHLAFGVRDIEKEAARLESSGIVHEPIRTDPFTGKKFLFFFDPDDLPLELYEL